MADKMVGNPVWKSLQQVQLARSAEHCSARSLNESRGTMLRAPPPPDFCRDQGKNNFGLASPIFASRNFIPTFKQPKPYLQLR